MERYSWTTAELDVIARAGWTAAELEAMSEADRERLFADFDDGPELAKRAREIIQATVR